MSEVSQQLDERAAEMRHAFDRTFARTRPTVDARFEDFLALRAGADPYALPLADVAGLYVGRELARLPDSPPEFLGLGAFRGALVPIFDLCVLLDSPAEEVPRWLAIVAGGRAGLAFHGFEGHMRLLPDAASVDERGEKAGQYVRGMVRTGGVTRPVIRISSILDTLAKRAHRSPQERSEES